jgi:aarF domain-containing kinase
MLSQFQQVMREDLGADWQSHFSSFDRLPFASASIGQVHRATLAATGEQVAVKIQFPGVADSIGADLAAIGLLLPAARLLPRGLFLERTLRILGQELREECDYLREGSWATRFRGWIDERPSLNMRVPWVWEGSTKRVLVMQFIDGVSVGGDQVQQLSQEDRNAVSQVLARFQLNSTASV